MLEGVVAEQHVTEFKRLFRGHSRAASRLGQGSWGNVSSRVIIMFTCDTRKACHGTWHIVHAQ